MKFHRVVYGLHEISIHTLGSLDFMTADVVEISIMSKKNMFTVPCNIVNLWRPVYMYYTVRKVLFLTGTNFIRRLNSNLVDWALFDIITYCIYKFFDTAIFYDTPIKSFKFEIPINCLGCVFFFSRFIVCLGYVIFFSQFIMCLKLVFVFCRAWIL